MLRLVDVRGVPFTPKFRNKKKTHFSIRRRNTSGINVPNIPKIGKRGKKILQGVPPAQVPELAEGLGRAILASLTTPQRRPSGHYP